MIRDTLRLIQEEFRGKEAFNDVARIASFHRIQCSPGLKDAARYIHSFLNEKGIQAELMCFPAKKGVRWWSQESFQEWKANDAELVLLEDGKRETLCAFGEIKTSLIQRSAATPPLGIETTMVYVEDGESAKSYEGIDVAGKLVFSRGNVTEIAKVAIDQFGAVGIVVDTMREHPPVRDRFDLPDGRQYLSFWPADPASHKALGFVVSPRQGESLRRRFAAGKKELKVFARVDTRFFDGTLEIPTAVIHGESDEEVVAVAHLCHPEPSANDNVSGCGTLMESVRTLSTLVTSGRLPKPRRTIRFLWVPEMTGSYAFLATHEDRLNKIVAAINLDMVGENQDLCGSTFTVERPVSALPGFGGDLAATILGFMTKEVGNFSGTHLYSTFRWTVAPYSGGSDHNIWGDPSVGVTCPMLIQWPDKYYHTSEDTIDKVDPRMLKVTGVLTSTYLYTAACATPKDAACIAGEAAARFVGEVDGLLSVAIDQAKKRISQAKKEETRDTIAKIRRSIERRVEFLVERKKMDIQSLLELTSDSPMFAQARAVAEKSVNTAGDLLLTKALMSLVDVAGLSDVSELPESWTPESTDSYKKASEIVPYRVFRGPFSSISKELPSDYREKAKAFSDKYGKISIPAIYLQYWADGKRTLAEIADLIEGETGFSNIDALVDYYYLMVERGIFKE